GLVRIQYGQETYGSLSEAEAAISTRSYNVESNIALNGITRAYLLVKEGTTSLTNTANAKIVDAGKFGNVSSSGGAITFASVVAALGYTPENVANKQNSLTIDGSGVKYPTVDAVNTKVSNIDNTSDLNKPISIATQSALNLKENTANKNTANGYAGLGSDGKLISSQLPAITITDTFVVGSQAAMLALTAETGDVAVRTDVNKSFILKGTNATILSDWQELLTPTSSVTSVFGRAGAVTANSGDYTADQINETASRKFQTLAQQTYNDATSSIQTQLNSKVGVSGTPNYLPKFTGASILGNSLIYDNGTNVGIGTTSPAVKLDVLGSSEVLRLRSNATANFFTFFNPSNSQIGDIGYDGRDTDILSIWNGLNGGMLFGTNASERMRITSSGNVGIGTTNPSSILTVGGTSGPATTPTAITMDGTYRTGGNAFDKLKFYLFKSSTESYGLGLSDDSDMQYWAGTTSTGNHKFFTSQLERMRISANGNVAIGDVTGAYKFYVNGGQYGTILKGGDLGVGSEIVKFAKADGSLAMFVRGDGNVGIANASPSEKLTVGGNVLAAGFFQSSDLRLKDIVKRDGDVIYYKWKDARDAKLHIGYVAQEVQKENPEQVNTDDKGMLSVNYIELLVEKIRKLEKEIELLKAK
ncbi:MAG: hypothetical protein RL311_776, partial [Bacteroidota bacterium]